MRILINLILLTVLTIPGYCQCELNQIIFLDSTRNQINSAQTDMIFLINNNIDTLKLEPLYDMEFTQEVDYLFFPRILDTTYKKDSFPTNQPYNCAICLTETIKIMDSIDVNGDGIKELFLFRRWRCSGSNNRTDNYKYMYLAGGQQQEYSQYQIWDVKTKKKIFEIKNKCVANVAVTTNVMSSFERYNFKVDIKKDGSISLPNQTGIYSTLKKGIYKYDKVAGTYLKE